MEYFPAIALFGMITLICLSEIFIIYTLFKGTLPINKAQVTTLIVVSFIPLFNILMAYMLIMMIYFKRMKCVFSRKNQNVA